MVRIVTMKIGNRPRRGDYNFDAWDIKPQQLVEIDNKIDSQWLTSDTLRHTLANKGLKKRKVPKIIFKKPSILPAVELPHPGTSYNPSYEDHQKLLHEVAEKEIKLMKDEAHLHRVTTKMFKKISPVESAKNWLQESSEGLPLPNSKDNKNVEDEDINPHVVSVNAPVRRNKKTRVQRRKIKEQNILTASRKLERQEKRKISDIYKIKVLEKKIENKVRKVQLLRKKKEKIKAIKAVEPKVLSKTKFEAPDPDFQLGEELSGNLRNTRPGRNLLYDRYKSLQQRNIVAPSTRILKLNKAKVKRYIKADHKITLPKASK